MTSLEKETFEFEARVRRTVTYVEEKAVSVTARSEDDAYAAIIEACSQAYRNDDLPEIVEVKVKLPDGSKDLEVFEINGADNNNVQQGWPDETEPWECDWIETNAEYEEAQAAAKDQAKCRQRNPELFVV